MTFVARHVLLLGLVSLVTSALPGQSVGPLDLVIFGGRVIDPESKLDAIRTVGIRQGRIVYVGVGTPAARASETKASEKSQQ